MCQASGITKSAVGVAREDFPAITAEEFDGLCVFVVVGLRESFESSRERERENFLRELAKTLLENWFSEF